MQVQFFEEACAFAKIKWEKQKEFSEKEQYILKWLERCSKKDCGNMYLHPSKINSWFQSILVKCLNKNPHFHEEVENVSFIIV